MLLSELKVMRRILQRWAEDEEISTTDYRRYKALHTELIGSSDRGLIGERSIIGFLESVSGLELVNCADCGLLTPNEGARETANGDGICSHCYAVNHFRCNGCEDIYHDDNRLDYGDDHYCRTCFDDRYGTCESCGDTNHWDDMRDNRCGDCYEGDDDDEEDEGRYEGPHRRYNRDNGTRVIREYSADVTAYCPI